MKIITRPQPMVVGHGPYTMNFTLEELQYIAVLAGITRLGQGSPYRVAAYNILTNLEETFDNDFMDQAYQDVQPKVSVEDDDGNRIETYSYENVTLEV